MKILEIPTPVIPDCVYYHFLAYMIGPIVFVSGACSRYIGKGTFILAEGLPKPKSNNESDVRVLVSRSDNYTCEGTVSESGVLSVNTDTASVRTTLSFNFSYISD